VSIAPQLPSRFHFIFIRIRIRQEVRRLPTAMSSDERQEIERKRQRLAAAMRDFHMTSSRLLGIEVVATRLGRIEEMATDGYVSDDLRESPGRKPDVSKIECTALVFPSSISGHISELLADLRQREMILR